VCFDADNKDLDGTEALGQVSGINERIHWPAEREEMIRQEKK